MTRISRCVPCSLVLGIAFTSWMLPPKVCAQDAETKPIETESIAAPAEAKPPRSAWLDSPLTHYYPRAGNFAIPPKGPGYYSGLDWLRGDWREAAPKSAFVPFGLMQPSFFDADWRYIDDPKYNPDLFEKLHRVHLGDNWLFGTGGQMWWRHMHEINSRLTGRTNDYDLVRARMYGDLWYQDSFRIYAEFITAQSFNEDLAPQRIDQNRADLLNLFVDIKIAEFNCRPAYLRVGRQELNIGSTRLISSLEWANTRRTFEGVRGFWLGEKWDVDLFWVRPVLVQNSRFDFADHNQNFAGAFVTHRPEKGQAIDFYYLYLDNHNRTAPLGIVNAPTVVHTLGSRYSGDKNGYLWDFEGAFQLGDRGGADIAAGMATAGVGYNWSKAPMNPTVWAYYDWASGDHSPNAGSYNTFNQLFPFGHYYLGFADYVGRQNVRDINFHLYLYPAKWVTFNAQYHIMRLDSATDALYAPNGTPTRVRTNGSAGGAIGQELDLLVNFHLGKHSDFLVGYSRLNAGEFISNTGPHRSPELFYAMYNFRW
jgi:hypothetical protein